MSGYAASAWLQGGAPRFVSVIAPGAAGATGRVEGATTSEPLTAGDGWIELVGRPLDERLAARWADLCEAWSQATFFLFDPESWR